MVTHVYKRSGRGEPYLESKLHESVRRAALEVRALEGEAELLADRVVAGVTGWLGDKAEVTSRDVRERAAGLLGALHADAAYAYAVHDATL